MLKSNELSSLLRRFLALAAIAAHLTANAGGPMVGGASEWTQIANNFELVKVSVDSAMTASATASQYMTQLEQYRVQLQNAAGMDPGALASSLRDVQTAYNNLANYKSALDRLGGGLSNESKAFDQRLIESKLLNLSWPEYVKKVGTDAANGNERAKERLRREEMIMQQVDRDYEFTREMQSKIPATAGQHEAIQLLNVQMNRVIAQNAQMISMMAKSQGSDKAQSEVDELNRRQQSVNEYNQYKKRMESLRARQNEMVGGK